MRITLTIKLFAVGFFLLWMSQTTYAQLLGANDTLLVGAVIYEGDTIEARVLMTAYIWDARNSHKRAEWTRLRNAVYVTYPYAKRAGSIFVDIEKNIAGMKNKKDIRRYIRTREKELRKEFTEPVTNLSVYQGRVLMKLINRETGGTNCYDIIRELRGGVTARFWQTVAFLFGGDLKQPYDARGQDAEIESLVLEVQRMYGYY